MAESRAESIKKLNQLTEGIDFCMLTTIDSGHLRSRPMSTQQFDENGVVWFFTSDESHKVEEIAKDSRVNLAYSNSNDDAYVSVSGRAELSKDRAKIEEMWKPIHKAWFPDGMDDPHLALLKVEAEQAEYWEASSSKIVQLFGFIKAVATGQEADYGENRKIVLS